MLNLDVSDLMVAFDEGSIKNVGPPDKSATAKLFDVHGVGVREFGDSQVKVVAEDDAGNEVQIALFPEQARAVLEDIQDLADDSPVFE